MNVLQMAYQWFPVICVLSADSGRYADTLISYTLCSPRSVPVLVLHYPTSCLQQQHISQSGWVSASIESVGRSVGRLTSLSWDDDNSHRCQLSSQQYRRVNGFADGVGDAARATSPRRPMRSCDGQRGYRASNWGIITAMPPPPPPPLQLLRDRAGVWCTGTTHQHQCPRTCFFHFEKHVKNVFKMAHGFPAIQLTNMFQIDTAERTRGHSL